MIIQVTDAHGVYVPRFCYHDKLSDRGQLPHVPGRGREGAEAAAGLRHAGRRGHEDLHASRPRPSRAQKATMEFLLINHPLDCPICDQGGECELQDLAMGFGRDVSRYAERKRVVKDKNLGPLVSTDMTRCIHCTRCVRFGQEIAGIQELGTIGRGEHMRDRHLHRAERRPRAVRQHHRPVPGRRAQQQAVPLPRPRLGDDAARRWSRRTTASAPTSTAHVLRGAADARRAARQRGDQRDLDRRPRPLQLRGHLRRRTARSKPMVREGGAWREVDWETALEAAAARPAAGRPRVGRRPARRARVAVRDARGGVPRWRALRAASAAATSTTGCVASTSATRRAIRRRRCSAARIAELEQAAARAGGGLRTCAAKCRCIAHRVRKGAVRRGDAGRVRQSAAACDLLFPVAGEPRQQRARHGAAPRGRAGGRAARRRASRRRPAVPRRSKASSPARSTSVSRRCCSTGDLRLVLLGALAERHVAYAEIRALAAALAAATGATLGFLPEGGNAVGAALAGVHAASRGRWPRRRRSRACTRSRCWSAACEATCCSAASSPRTSRRRRRIEAALRGAECVVALTPYAGDELLANAHRDPAGRQRLPRRRAPGSTSRAAGRACAGAARPPGEARPRWKVLRVLGNLLGLPGFDYLSSEEVRDELRRELDEAVGRRAAGCRRSRRSARRGRFRRATSASTASMRWCAARAPLQADALTAATGADGGRGMIDFIASTLAVVARTGCRARWSRSGRSSPSRSS